MKKIQLIQTGNLKPIHKNDHRPYEYYRKQLVGPGSDCESIVSIFEIPPGRSPYPYHYHTSNEESFYILSGKGIIRTPDGEHTVAAGDFILFPTGEAGAHKVTNASETEPLVYLDYSTKHKIDITFYPDSKKVGINASGMSQFFKAADCVDYYDGE